MALDVRSIISRIMPKFLKGITLGALVALLGASLAATTLALRLEEGLGLGWLFTVRGTVDPPAGVYIISMDKASADFLKQPVRPRDWSRLLHAELIERLVQHGVSTIIFDVFFESAREPKDDKALATAMKRSERVVLVQKVVRDETSDVIINRLVSSYGEVGSAPIGLGPFPLPKIPNRVSQTWTFYQAGGDVPTLPVVAIQVHTINTLGYVNFKRLFSEANIVTTDELPSSIENAEDTWRLMALLRQAFERDSQSFQRLVPTLNKSTDLEITPTADRAIRALSYAYRASDSEFLNFYGPSRTIVTIPYGSFWENQNSFAELPNLENSIVLVGQVTDSPSDQLDGFFTVYSTEKGLDLGGVEIAATALGNLLEQSNIHSLSMAWIMVILSTFGMLAGILASLIPGLKGTLVVCIMGVGYFVLTLTSFSGQHLWWPVFIPLAVQLPFAALAGITLHYLSARKVSQTVTQAMGHYIPQRIANQIAEQGSEPSTAPALVYATCLCSDVANYTTLSEKVSPEELSRLSNEYFGLLGDCIKNHDGDMLDLVGDGMTCVWTTSEPQQGIRLQACLAALEILEDIERFNNRHPGHCFPTRIGLNAGYVAVGNIGGGGHFSYSVTGDIVNSASRIEGLNKQLHTRLLAAESVVGDIDQLLVRRVGSFVLKGKAEPLTVFEIVDQQGSAPTATIDLCRHFDIAMELFDNRRWEEASRSFEILLATFPDDGPTRFYLDLCKLHASKPESKAQDTVIRLNTK